MAQDQLQQHQAGLDGFAEADIVRDQQVDPGHFDRAHDGIELVGLELDASAEGGLNQGGIRHGRSAPAHRVQEGVQPCWFVEVGGLRQRHLLVDFGPRLQFPYDLEFLAEALVVDAGERDEVLWPRFAADPRRQHAPFYVRDDEPPLAHLRQLPLLRRRGRSEGREGSHSLPGPCRVTNGQGARVVDLPTVAPPTVILLSLLFGGWVGPQTCFTAHFLCAAPLVRAHVGQACLARQSVVPPFRTSRARSIC